MGICESCRHFTGRIAPQGVCVIWHKVMTASEAAVHRCPLWQAVVP